MTMSPDNEVYRFICVRVADLPVSVTGSVRVSCAQCGQTVWVASSSRARAGVTRVEYVCNQCYRLSSPKGPPPEILPETRQEVKALLSLTDDEIEDLVDDLHYGPG